MLRFLVLATCISLTACGGSKSDDKGKAGSAAAKPVERDVKAAQRALASIKLPAGWTDMGSTTAQLAFVENSVSAEIYLDQADTDTDVMAELQPAKSLDELVAKAARDRFADGWPVLGHRFASITDKGAAGDAIWVRGPVEDNDACGDHGCDRTAWHAGRGAGFVVFRAKGDTRYRCSARAEQADDKTLEEAFAFCKSGAWVP